MTLTIENLSDIYYLFIEGMLVGGLLSGLPFIIGYAIEGVYKVIRSNT